MKYIRVPLDRLVRVKKIVTCFTQANAPHVNSGLESHDFWELVFLRRGRIGYRSGEKNGVLTAGEAVLHAPNVVHGLVGDGTHEGEFFIISFECDSPVLSALASGRFLLSASARRLTEEIMAERERCFVPGVGALNPLVPLPEAPIGSQQMIALYLELLLIGLLRERAAAGGGLFPTRTALEEHLAADICAYLEERLYDRVNMQELCACFHYGNSQLCAAFRHAMGDSIMHWYQVRKMEEAQRLLLESDRSVAEIATLMGFDSPQYFSRAFAKQTGLCPRDFRASRQ